jgi:hypothetical protein
MTMPELSDRQREKLQARGVDEAEFREIVRESETVLEVQRRTRVRRKYVVEVLNELELNSEVKYGGAMIGQFNCPKKWRGGDD